MFSLHSSLFAGAMASKQSASSGRSDFQRRGRTDSDESVFGASYTRRNTSANSIETASSSRNPFKFESPAQSYAASRSSSTTRSTAAGSGTPVATPRQSFISSRSSSEQPILGTWNQTQTRSFQKAEYSPRKLKKEPPQTIGFQKLYHTLGRSMGNFQLM